MSITARIAIVGLMRQVGMTVGIATIKSMIVMMKIVKQLTKLKIVGSVKVTQI